MRRMRALLLRLAGVFGMGRRDRDIDDELRAHRDELTDEYIRAGLAPDAAGRRAAAELGSLSAAAEAYRDRRGLPAFEHMVRDTHMAVRSLARTPLLSITVIAVLAFGVGVSTAVVAVFHAVVWDTLPVPEPDAVVRLTQRFEGQVDRRVRGNVSLFSYYEFQTYRRATSTLAALAASVDVDAGWRHESGTRRLHGVLVTGDYFTVLPMTPSLGRFLSDADADQPVVVISHALWKTAFGGRSDAIGQVMRLDGTAYTIVGVAPPSLTSSGADQPFSNFWLPLEARYRAQHEEAFLLEGNVSWLHVLGRLKAGTSIASSQAEAPSIAAGFDAGHPGRRTTITVSRASLIDRQGFQTQILAAGGVITALLGILFLICGSNAAALLLARGTSRQKEIAVRLALGASRMAIVRQLGVEIALMAFASALGGIVLCMAALRQLASAVPMHDLLLSIRPDERVFALAFGAACLVALVFGLAPLRQALGVDCLANLKGEGSIGGKSLSGMRLRRALIAAQVAISVPLLVVAALLGRGVSQAWRADLGFVTKGVYAIEPDMVSPETSGALMARLRAMPGVSAVGRALVAPFFGYGMSHASTDPTQQVEAVRFNQVGDGFFEALGVPLVAGRWPGAREQHVVIVNARLARRFWLDEREAVGKGLYAPVAGSGNQELVRMQVVGVVPTLQTATIGVPDEPTFYSPLLERRAATIWTLVRIDSGAAGERMVDQIRALFPETEMRVIDLESRLLDMTRPARVAIVVTASIGLLALFIAAVGVHGVVSFTVATRARDIGIFQALGARPAQVCHLVLGWTLRGVAMGAAVSVVLLGVVGVVFSGPLRPVFNGVNSLDGPAFLAGLVTLVLVIGIAAYLPARRAIAMTPLAALRQDWQ